MTKRFEPTRGVYDLVGAAGAAGPVQFFAALAALATVLLAGASFGYPPFTAVGLSVLAAGHVVGVVLRLRDASLRTRLLVSTACLMVTFAVLLLTPSGRDAIVSPDMREDTDYRLAGTLVWLAVGGQWYASAPGVLMFLMLPELAAFAVFSQLNVDVMTPACYALYLVSALGVLAYSNFIRRPYGAAVAKKRVAPGTRDIMYAISVLALLLGVGGGIAAVALEAAVPSLFSRQWFSGYFFQTAGEGDALDSFSNELKIVAPDSAEGMAPVLSVRTDRPLLLRRRVYADYTGHGWLPGPQQVGGLWRRGQQSIRPNQIVGRPSGDMVDHAVRPAVRVRGTLPVAGAPAEIIPHTDTPMLVDRDGIVWLGGILPSGSIVEVRSDECLSDMPELDELPAAFPMWAASGTYLSVTPESLALSDLVRDITADRPSVSGKVEALQRYIETECAYNLNAPAPDPGQDAAVEFVTTRKQGACTDFATALVVMCRLAGIPARVVTGYSATEPDPSAPDWLVVREKHAHAWAEVFLPGAGWTTFNPAPANEITGTWADRLAGSIGRAVRKFLAAVVRNLLVLVLLGPVGYIALYHVRRRRAPKHGPRARAGLGLRGLMRSLEPVVGWSPPGTTARELLSSARGRLPEALCDRLAAVLRDLTALCFDRDEPDRRSLAAALRAARHLSWSLWRVLLPRLELRRFRGFARRRTPC